MARLETLAEEFLSGVHPQWVKLLSQTPDAFESAAKAGSVSTAAVVKRVLEPLRFFSPEETTFVAVHCPEERVLWRWASSGALVVPLDRADTWCTFYEILVLAACSHLKALGRKVWVWLPDDKLRRFIAGHDVYISRYCPSELAALDFQPDDGPVVLACDGSCSNNGKPSATAGFGVVAFGGLEISGPVLPFTYEWIDPRDPRRGFRQGCTPALPSNNRGEYLAMCYLLLAVCRAGLAAAPVEIISDSEILCKTLLEWLPTWKRKGKLGAKKNVDLVVIADDLFTLANTFGPVKIVHVNSHQPEPEQPDRRRRWAANKRADELASRGNKTGAVQVSSPFWIPGLN